MSSLLSVMDAMLQSLRLGDRSIKLVIGEPQNATTFYISQNLLEQTADYSTSALRNQHLGSSNERDTLHFPEDEVRAWGVLLYWIVKHKLPLVSEVTSSGGTVWESAETSEIDQELSVRCWVLGDKYGIPAFQDLIMLELLKELDIDTRRAPITAVKLAFDSTPPGSALRELMAEEAAMVIKDSGAPYDALDQFDGIVGFTRLLVASMECRDENDGGYTFLPRVPDVLDPFPGQSTYRQFMVGEEILKPHWVHAALLKIHGNLHPNAHRW
ncbi:hypothetical protein LTS10_000455 [Elasticomyces elasticus]|nr:hypothetical protein LTS10_000455 [Elasticomyces elasticus]